MIIENEDSVTMETPEDIEHFFSEEYHKGYLKRKRAKMNIFERVYSYWDYRPYKYRLYRRFDHWCWTKYGIPPKMKYFLQRAKRGWATADTWNLNTFYESVMIDSLKYFRDNLHGCPMAVYDENGIEITDFKHYPEATTTEEVDQSFKETFEIWESTLNAIISGLEDGMKLDDLEPPYDKLDELKDSQVKAIKLLAYNWRSLWD